MDSSLRRQIVVCLADFLLTLAVLYISRNAGGYPTRWYWILATGVLWTLTGIITHKLQFEKYRRATIAILSILLIDGLTFTLLILTCRFAFPSVFSGVVRWYPLAILVAVEIAFYYLFRKLVLRKIPYFFEGEVIIGEDAEPSVSKGIKVEEDKSVLPDEFLRIWETVRNYDWNAIREWFRRDRDTLKNTLILDDVKPRKITASDIRDPQLIILTPRFNDIRHVNTFLAFSNYKLPYGGCIVLHGQTSGSRREQIYKENPSGLNHIIFFFDYIWSRVFPKLHTTRWFYMLMTKGKNRCFPRVELLGRLCRSGFTIAGEEIRDGEYIVAAVKTDKPIEGDHPSYGPMVRLQRVGYQGKLIDVYKLRTMYSYSEYLQKYAYERLGLQKGGKLKSDFRINIWGKCLRRIWIDEIPMIFSLFTGDLKLVGVRPISRHYFSLYSPEMQALRITVKPGLVPPFYCGSHSPDSIVDIQENERRYIEDYKKAPCRTDFRYFCRFLYNFIFRHPRSR